MTTRIAIALICTGIAFVASAGIVKSATHKASPLVTPAATPVAMIQTVTGFKLGEHAIEVQSTPDTRSVKYLLARKVRFVDAETGKAVDPRKIHPGTRVRLESKTGGHHGIYRRVVVLQPDRL
jgi:hypothetical protein